MSNFKHMANDIVSFVSRNGFSTQSLEFVEGKLWELKASVFQHLNEPLRTDEPEDEDQDDDNESVEQQPSKPKKPTRQRKPKEG